VRDFLRGLFLGRGERIAGIVYGTIIVMSVIAAGSAGTQTNAAEIAALAIPTSIVLWIAHVYAHALELSVESGRRLTWANLRTLARREASIVRAAVLPAAALLLGAFGLLADRTAVWLALGLGTTTLGGEAFVYARLEGLGKLATGASVGVNLALGLTVVALEASLAH
jgi:hypothetical protein